MEISIIVVILLFDSYGEVRVDAVNCGLSYSSIQGKSKEGFGYYKVNKDSIFFTTKSFYRKSPNEYRGKILDEGNKIKFTTYVKSTGKWLYEEYIFVPK